MICIFFKHCVQTLKEYWAWPLSWQVQLLPPQGQCNKTCYAPMLHCLQIIHSYWIRRTTKPTKWHVRPAKTQISLSIHPVWSVFAVRSMGSKDPNFLHADSEDSDQTGWILRLIWVFDGRTCHFVGFVMRRLIFKKFCSLYYCCCVYSLFNI